MTAAESSHCGSYTGYQSHLKNGTKVCDSCRAEAKRYRRDWRRRNPPAEARARHRQYARSRALAQLGKRYPEELEELISIELRRSDASHVDGGANSPKIAGSGPS